MSHQAYEILLCLLQDLWGSARQKEQLQALLLWDTTACLFKPARHRLPKIWVPM
jgi:hypothetical protein